MKIVCRRTWPTVFYMLLESIFEFQYLKDGGESSPADKTSGKEKVKEKIKTEDAKKNKEQESPKKTEHNKEGSSSKERKKSGTFLTQLC